MGDLIDDTRDNLHTAASNSNDCNALAGEGSLGVIICCVALDAFEVGQSWDARPVPGAMLNVSWNSILMSQIICSLQNSTTVDKYLSAVDKCQATEDVLDMHIPNATICVPVGSNDLVI